MAVVEFSIKLCESWLFSHHIAEQLAEIHPVETVGGGLNEHAAVLKHFDQT